MKARSARLTPLVTALEQLDQNLDELAASTIGAFSVASLSAFRHFLVYRHNISARRDRVAKTAWRFCTASLVLLARSYTDSDRSIPAGARSELGWLNACCFF